jgi:hypothetical protein
MMIAPDMGYSERPLIVGPRPPAGASCTRVTEYASPGQELVAMVANGEAFVIVG